MLLPLEQNVIMTEINKELQLSGFSCIKFNGGKVDPFLSTYEVLSHINALFPNLEIPFGYIWECTVQYVAEWKNHFDRQVKPQ